ncbi:sulfate transporter CysZ [Affinibrenneria salicis]|uniref:Sulfate transporter CysZ n=1 Tax=Affinibrenneria salicis TaxID=2590031 RepID=A0A5J5G7P0_9GAMM|nr:sulfate transporter CysZ [Affinibrenneria salicis]KAA9002513.1 sulfate transporter CysZ [Affinibrenneria salicis]KAA9003199.1 sulfate transporter CysZ [Affinibrenneria salicis]
MTASQHLDKPRSGFHYFFVGLKLISQPGLRRFVILPLLVNIVLMGGAFWWLFTRLNDWIPGLLSHVPDWLQWLSYLLWPLAVISILLVFSYLFSTVANIIASPFNGLLAEQLEARLTGQPLPDGGLLDALKDVPRTLKREMQKLGWYLPRIIILLILYFIPVIGQTVVPVLWFLFSAWMQVIQYCDYPFDNHKISFPLMRKSLRQHKISNLQFGSLISVVMLIPILNLIVMPVAVCGATALWVDRYRQQH